jgi:CRP/FNR family transcriptional regulator
MMGVRQGTAAPGGTDACPFRRLFSANVSAVAKRNTYEPQVVITTSRDPQACAKADQEFVYGKCMHPSLAALSTSPRRGFDEYRPWLAAPQCHALEEALCELDHRGTRVKFSCDQTIFSEGEAATRTYRIIHGTVRLCSYACGGRRQIAEFMFEGDFLGFFEQDAYGLCAEGVTEVWLSCYWRADVDRLLAHNNEAANDLLMIARRNIAAMRQTMAELGCRNAKQRVAGFLFRLNARARLPAGKPTDFPMSRSDIGAYLGLADETVSRALSELRREGVIDISGSRKFVIIDLVPLQKAAEGEDPS